MVKIFQIAILIFAYHLPGEARNFSRDEVLSAYWPLGAPPRVWTLINHKDRQNPAAEARMTVASKSPENKLLELSFSGKTGQEPGEVDVERFEYCDNPGGEPWLFLTAYVDLVPGKLPVQHPILATKILFTPHNSQPEDLIKDGTYARCGGSGQPYLYWTQNLQSYRIQVWGYLSENVNLKWYWDAEVSRPEPVKNDCVTPSRVVKAIKVKEAWWSNFRNSGGAWTIGTGKIGEDGLPAGAGIGYGRTVWHAEGQIPYYMVGSEDQKKINLCMNRMTR